MTAIELRVKGYTVLFYYGEVFISRKGGDLVYITPNNGGRWMDIESVSHPEFKAVARWNLPGHAATQLLAAEEHCYCVSLPDTTCDFCGNARRA